MWKCGYVTKMMTLLDEDQARGVDELGQKERVGAQDVADGGNPRALELLVVLGPELGDATLGLDALIRPGGPDPLEPALLGLVEPSRGVALPKATCTSKQRVAARKASLKLAMDVDEREGEEEEEAQERNGSGEMRDGWWRVRCLYKE